MAGCSTDVRIWMCALVLAASATAESVGSKSCAGCHAQQSRAFEQSPMGRSLTAAASTIAAAQFVHQKTGRRYRVFRKSGELIIEESLLDGSGRLIYSDPRRVSYVIGSGN